LKIPNGNPNALGQVMESEIAEIPTVLENLLNSTDKFEQLARLISETKIASVQILARGTSDNAAHFLKYLIETQIGIPVGLTSPSSVTIYNTKLHFEGTLIVAISQSGQSTDLLEFAKSAKLGGAKLVGMTNDADSPLAKLSDFHISLLAGPEYAVAATKSYAAQLFASLLLVRAWGAKFSGIDSIVADAKATLSLSAGVREAVEKCDSSREIVVLGRGFSYPNAREMALKIQETSKVSVQGFSIADYMHGPISALTQKSQVIVIAPHGISLDYFASDIAKIRTASPDIYWLGSGEMALEGEIVILGASCGSEIISSICDAILMQTFALEFARKNKLNPDSPEGLNKVTFTR
jgi:glucosamine--fructose-6-phosphate aminotransferase (isomerizing)